MDGYYSRNELKKMGFRCLGENVLLSRLARVFRPSRVSIGNNVRIDDYCVLSGDISLGNNVFLALGVKIMGGSAEIIIGNYVGISFQTVIIGESDDYSGEYLTGPIVPDKYRNVYHPRMIIEDYSTIGANCTILPGVRIAEGCSFGASSLINKNTEKWSVYIGQPCRKLKNRKKDMRELASELDDTTNYIQEDVE